jgi:hypothetical protein
LRKRLVSIQITFLTFEVLSHGPVNQSISQSVNQSVSQSSLDTFYFKEEAQATSSGNGGPEWDNSSMFGAELIPQFEPFLVAGGGDLVVSEKLTKVSPSKEESGSAQAGGSTNWGALFDVGLSAVGLLGSAGCAVSAAGLEVSTLGAASPVALPTLAVCSAGVALSLNGLDAGIRSLKSGANEPSLFATGLSQWTGLTMHDAELAVSVANVAAGVGVAGGIRSTGRSLIKAEDEMISKQIRVWDDMEWHNSFKVNRKPGSLLWSPTNQPIREGYEEIFSINKTMMQLYAEKVIKP